MFQSWRFKLRESEEAMKAGRLDEARRLIGENQLIEFLPGKRLAVTLASRFAGRARQFAQAGDWGAGWRDLDAAVALAEETSELATARQTLVAAALREAECDLGRANGAAALAIIEKLERRKVASAELRTLRDVARRVESARYLCRRGRFADAEAQLATAVSLRPNLADLQRLRDECRGQKERAQKLTDELHRALGEERYRDAAAVAEQLLALAPESRLARDARRRAWAEVGANLTESRRLGMTQTWLPGQRSVRAGSAEEEATECSGNRFVLWVDGVGGYLVCMADEVVCGQASPGNRVDVPILADISRRHAKIRREGEGYVLEPLHATRINGRSAQSKTLLSDGDEIEFGSGVRLRFRQPHALSGSARLEFVSRHRPQPFADGVLLMAESCVLGPQWQNHVVCREWAGDVVLYRQDDALFCRAMESIEIDGQLCDGRGRLDGNSHVVGSDFSLSLEELDRCSTQPLR